MVESASSGIQEFSSRLRSVLAATSERRAGTLIGIFVVVSMLLVIVASARPSPAVDTSLAWASSYAVDGVCYCSGDLSDDIASTDYDGQSVGSICSRIGSGPIVGRIHYNTVQCGSEPAGVGERSLDGEVLQDELVCPGRVGDGVSCNSDTGPTWDLSFLQLASAPEVTTTVPATTSTAPTTSEQPELAAMSLRIIDARSQRDVGVVFDRVDQTVPLASIPADALAFDLLGAPEGTQSVAFEVFGALDHFKIENVPPYSMFGNAGPAYAGGSFGPGTYVVDIQAFDGPDGLGRQLAAQTISFTISA